ncbi:sugar transferase [Krasilnikovia sp. M28-CT-15]|uniref:sugar transferase n=1 Tax=Krasilnikovia sp. M28-CT-15 TaxID=3373540 RepID=UPI003876FF06
MSIANSAAKRCTDVVLSLLLLVATAPVLLLAILAVWIDMGRPFFFTQERTGLGGQPFRLVKLRTMRVARDDAGRDLPDAERLTRLGGLLRMSSIDELPGLFNVLRGEMSLVGPRPLLPTFDDWYLPRERLRFTVRPGITGLAQVRGRNHLGWDERFELDVWYVENWSLLLDLRILAATFVLVLSAKGVVVDPAAVETDLDVIRGFAP